MHIVSCGRSAVRVLSIVALAAAAAAQEPPGTAPATQPATAPGVQVATEPSADAIRAQIATLEAAGELPEAVRTEALSLYRQALEQLARAETFAQAAAEYERRAAESPVLLAELRARATQPAPAAPEPVAADAPLEELARRLAEAEQRLRSAQELARRLDEEARGRADRKAVIPGLLAEANRQLERVTQELAAPPAADVSPQVAVARRALLLARKRALESELRAYEQELRFYAAAGELLSARREEARLAVAAAEAQVAALAERVSQRRQAEVQQAREQAERELAEAPRAVRELAQANLRLAERRTQIAARIDALRAQTRTVRQIAEALEREAALWREALQRPGLSGLVGPRMRRLRAQLNEYRGYQLELRAHTREYGQAVYARAELEEELLELADLDRQTERFLQGLEGLSAAARQRLAPVVREQYAARRDRLEQLVHDYESLEAALTEVIQAESELLPRVEELTAFIGRHVLWIPSAEPLHRTELPRIGAAELRRWQAALRSLRNDAAAHPVAWTLVPLLCVVLVAGRRLATTRLERIREQVQRPLSDLWLLTLRALLWTVLLALPGPLLLGFVGQRLGSAVAGAGEPAGYGLELALGAGLRAAAWVWLTLALVRAICLPNGLGIAHFGWEEAAVRGVRRALAPLGVVLVPATLIALTCEWHPEAAMSQTVGRAALLAGLLATAVAARRLAHPVRGALGRLLVPERHRWLYPLRGVGHAAAVLVPLGLALASAAGYHYTAVELSERLIWSLWLVLGITLVHALLVRWVVCQQRRLAIEQARRRRAALAEGRAREPAAAAEQEEINIVSLGGQTRRLLRSLGVLALLLGLWGIWSGMLPALGFLHDVTLWRYTVRTAPGEGGTAPAEYLARVTLAHLAAALLVAVATAVLARNLPGLLEMSLLARLPLDTGARYAITAVSRYAITVVGIVVAFATIGIGWSKVQWLLAAVTVGLGFGLQEIFANFVSGLILLAERPVRVGDTVTVAGVTGTVTRIRIRATTIVDWDRKELVIPNRELVTGQLINWTLSDSMLRISVPVGIAYGSDTDRAEEILYRVARQTPWVLADPAPSVVFLEFGDSALQFELRVYVAGVEHLWEVRHLLHKRIDAAFREAGIEIAFPQRDIHVRSIRAALPGAVAPQAAAEPAAPRWDAPGGGQTRSAAAADS